MTIEDGLSTACSDQGISGNEIRNMAASGNRRRFQGEEIPIRLASTEEQLEAVYQFRYQVYIQEMNMQESCADHSNNKIEDSLDGDGYNFAAFREGEVVGAVRVNFPRKSSVSYYETYFDMCSVGFLHPRATSICTRLMVAPRLRRTNLAVRLAEASYRFGLHNQIRYNFIDCADHLIGFFARLGYIVHRRAEHPEYGIGTVMRLDLLDRARLAQTWSPFVAIFDEAIKALPRRGRAIPPEAEGSAVV